ncbi:phosphotransferase [bacterium]|nr:phosphotransferase [bacterium]
MNTSYIELAEKYIGRHYCEKIDDIKRLETGLCHYVFLIRFENKKELVIRIGSQESENLIISGIYWNKYLSNIDLPIPKLYHYNMDIDHPYMIMEKIEGLDLAYVYDTLSGKDKLKLAREIVSIQNLVSQLQPNDYYGYAEKYFDPKLSSNTSWKQVIYQAIMRAKRRIEETHSFELIFSELLLSKLPKFDSYFSKIKAKAFLDDLTTKNVMVKDGKLTGIVDIDQVCFGDKLFHLALTRMALLSQNSSTDYVDFIIDEYNLDSEEREVLDFYTSVCCLDFMSEIGHNFNKDKDISADSERKKLLESIFYKYHNSSNIMKTDMMRYGDSCVDFYEANIITDIIRVVKQGKEATVICAQAHQDMGYQYLAIKLYREKKFRNFKRDNIYHIGRVWDQRLLRAMRNKTKIGQQAERSSWVSNEFNSLETLHSLGLPVPKPIAYTDDAIVMEFLGQEDVCSSLLKDTRLSHADAKLVFHQLIEIMVIMLKNNIVHGDLSPYNILYHQGQPYIIDFPQAVNPSVNIYAYDLLLRDVENICKYFHKYGIEANPEEITDQLWTPNYGHERG